MINTPACLLLGWENLQTCSAASLEVPSGIQPSLPTAVICSLTQPVLASFLPFPVSFSQSCSRITWQTTGTYILILASFPGEPKLRSYHLQACINLGGRDTVTTPMSTPVLCMHECFISGSLLTNVHLQSVVQSPNHVQLFTTPWTAAHQASLSFTTSSSLPKLMSFESVMPSNHLILCCSRLLPSIFPSITVFSNESAVRLRWPQYWNLSISPSNEYSGLTSFEID